MSGILKSSQGKMPVLPNTNLSRPNSYKRRATIVKDGRQTPDQPRNTPRVTYNLPGDSTSEDLCLRGSSVPSLPGSRATSAAGHRASPAVLSEREYTPITGLDDGDTHDAEIQDSTRSEPGYCEKDYLSLEEYPIQRSITSFSAPAQYAASRGFCVRSRSAILREADGLVSSLSRQCCDVLGPKICHECAIIKRRQHDTKRYESFLPRVEITEENLATTLLIAKRFPTMTLEEVQSKVSQGEILKPTFRFNVERIKQRKLKESLKGGDLKTKDRPVSQKPVTYTYFRSIKDLNRKFTSGQMVRKIILTGDSKRDLQASQKTKSAESQTFTETVSPVFVSARKDKPEKQRHITYYEPPLLPKVCQNVEPAFFAGKQTAYTLPPAQGKEIDT